MHPYFLSIFSDSAIKPCLKTFLFLTCKYCKNTLPFAIFSETLKLCFAHQNLLYMAPDEMVSTVAPGVDASEILILLLPSLSRDQLLLTKGRLVFPGGTVETDLIVLTPEPGC